MMNTTKTKIPFVEFLQGEKEYFKDRPPEDHAQWLNDFENCLDTIGALEFKVLDSPEPDGKGGIVFMTGGFNWQPIIDKINSLERTYSKDVEFF